MHVPRLVTRNRSLWQAMTIIAILFALLFSPVGLSLVEAVGENLLTSDITASQNTLAPGEELTFTVTLRNTGSAGATAEVTVVLPDELTYVAGSVTGGGSLEDGNVVWNGVPVAAGESVPLSFRATPDVVVSVDTEVNTVAAIMSEHLHLTRLAQVTLVPSDGEPPTPVPNLSESYKSASKYTVVSDDSLEYTIHLRNSGTEVAVVDVVDYLPDLVSYVSSPEGSYDAGEHTVSWTDVNVPADDDVQLTVEVMAEAVSSPTAATNVASITFEDDHFERQVSVLVVPDSPPPMPDLWASFKSASKHKVVSDEVVTYSIHLHNSGTEDAIADVVDQLPVEMAYVDGSADPAAVYASGELTWNDVDVPAGDEVLLTFQAKAATVEEDTVTTNVATISWDDESIERSAYVTIVPELLPDGDVTPPTVESLIIDDQDVLTVPDVMLYISASDDESVEQMYLEEWQLVTSAVPHWEKVSSSGWVPYATEYAWTLQDTSGTHAVVAWVADAAGNKSHLAKSGFDYASLLLPGESLSKGGVASYLVYYDAGVDVTATLDTLSGDVDLYVWSPGHHAVPDAYSAEAGTTIDEVSFTTPAAGTYLFVVHGWEASTFDLSITPGGGPQASTAVSLKTQSSYTVSDAVVTDKTQLQEDPVLVWSGQDPLPDTTEPSTAPKELYKIYMPIVAR